MPSPILPLCLPTRHRCGDPQPPCGPQRHEQTASGRSYTDHLTATSLLLFTLPLFHTPQPSSPPPLATLHSRLPLASVPPGIAVVTLNRPAARNAISKQLLADLLEAMAEVRGDGGAGGVERAGKAEGAVAGTQQEQTGKAAVRVVIIRSAVDGVFCAGADLKERKGMTQEEAEAFVSSLREAFTDLENLPVPTVAAVEGAALGGGLEMLLACDIRVAGFNARFGLPETSLAIIPGAGGTQRLPRLVGASRAKELIFTARVVRADEALSLGIVSHCVPAGTAHDTALEIARTIQRN
ncbi:unnamed protein product, partial [Closterium sp. NIES-65]